MAKRSSFSSNRGGNLDLWTINTRTGAVGQLTDDEARDWDPAYTADGSQIVWSSDRGGNLEIWIANADGSGARQVSSDGIDAENPGVTPDGEWVVYMTSNPDKPPVCGRSVSTGRSPRSCSRELPSSPSSHRMGNTSCSTSRPVPIQEQDA